MADLTAVCNGLAVVLQQIPGLRVSAEYVSQVNPPMAVIMPQPQQSLRFDSMDGGVSYLLRIVVLLTYAQDSSSVTQMNAYLATTGTQSIPSVIRNNPRLAGTYDYLVLESTRGYGLTTWGGQEYLGCQFTVTAMASVP